MNATLLDDAQQRAVAYPADSGPVAIVGAAGSGKSLALLRRAARLAAGGRSVIVTSPAIGGIDRLAVACAGLRDCELRCASLAELAFAELQAQSLSSRSLGDVVEIDEGRAIDVFARVVARLFALDWAEFEAATIDPEVPGLRTPERFAATAFRLIRKLRLGGVDAATFESDALRGAMSFYGRLPNFANPQLTLATQAQHRDSLRATPNELAHQYAREVDLAKILARLYREYVKDVVECGFLTDVDAVVEATRTAGGAAPRSPLYVLVDDAQDLSRSELDFLRTLSGNGLERATFAGDAAQATRTFEARASDALKRAPAQATFALAGSYRCPPAVVAAAQAIVAAVPLPRAGRGPDEDSALRVIRFESVHEEASVVARTIADRIATGLEASQVAVVLRTLNCVDAYATALLANDVPIDFSGLGSLYDQRVVQDALAPLWAVADPNRHDWLIRNLEAPWLACSDATIALLCGSPSDPQPLLFEMPEEPDDDDRRWDRQRDLRLARNVLRGDRDRELPAAIGERLSAFRAARDRWLADERSLELPARARLVFEETVLSGLANDARGRFARGLIARLERRIANYWEARPRASLLDFLRDAESAASDRSGSARFEPYDRDAVGVLDVESAKGREFASVFVVDVRAGAFPRYYVPDSFLFTRGLGMISKDNVGDAATAQRTAKFSYANHALDFRSKYNAQERRALACAMTRARTNLWVSASGRATQGKAAPELLEELRARA